MDLWQLTGRVLKLVPESIGVAAYCGGKSLGKIGKIGKIWKIG